MAGSNGLPAAESQTSRKDMEVESNPVDEDAEKDTWYCLQCRRRPYYERNRLDAILRNAERDVQVDWTDIEAGAGQIPSKMDRTKVSGTTRELFPPNPVCHASPNGSGALRAVAAALKTRPTSNQIQAQAQLFVDNCKNSISTQPDITSDTGESTTVAFDATSISTTGEKADAHQRETSIMAPHLESKSAVFPVLHVFSLTRSTATKRKASEDASSSRSKKARTESPEQNGSVSSESQSDPPITPTPVDFPEKPAVTEEKTGTIEFRVVNNDNSREHNIILTGLKCIFQKQLPKMPKDYIARLVYDKTHLSIAIIKHPLEVVGGITYRPFNSRTFAEIVFCAISSDQQVKGYGAHLMAHLKDYVKATSPIMHFLTYADNYAIGYFKKQGFTKEITLEKSVWMGYIKDYEGGTIMQCSMLPKIRYLEAPRMLVKQKEAVMAKIRAISKSHVIHPPPAVWKNGITEIDPMSIPAIKASGWSPSMDELSRQPRHGPNYNALLHLLNDMQNHTSAWPFAQPVNREEVPDYYEVIKEPMDLSTMEDRLQQDMYPRPEDFIKDAKLVFDNCRKYNNETTPYAKSANKLEKYMWSEIKKIPEWSHLAD